MKAQLQTLIAKLLAVAAETFLKREKPRIVAVTGSVGKTTTKELIRHLVTGSFRVRAGKNSQNTPLGVPATILGLSLPHSSLGWFLLPFAAWRASRERHIVDVVIVELGVDKPGDMAVLTAIAKPEIGVILAVQPVHLMAEAGQFSTLEEVAHEKAGLARTLPKHGVLFINDDDPRVKKLAEQTRATVKSFGRTKRADITSSLTEYSLDGLHFELKLKTEPTTWTDLFAPLIGEHQLTPIMAAVAVAHELGVSQADITTRLKTFKPPPGRLKKLVGQHQMTILDDSYNANPASMIASVRALAHLKTSGRRVAILGNMNELGVYAKEGHEQVGEAVAHAAPDLLITIGERAVWIAQAAIQAGFPASQHRHFANPKEALREVPRLLKQHDLVLIKASQNGMQLERLVKVLMAEPDQAPSLLVRQDWH